VELADGIAGAVILMGVLGIVVPLLPGTLLVAAALVGWGLAAQSVTAWVLVACALAVLAVGAVIKYAVPGRRLRSAGVPLTTLLCGTVVGVVGFFVVPVVGLVAGFVLGVYAAEVRRLGSGRAWPATRSALAAVGLSLLIELGAALVATALWLTAVVAT